MLSDSGCFAVALKFTNSKNCFVYLPSHLVSQLHLQEGQAVELSWDFRRSAFLSWVRHAGFCDEKEIGINRHLGEKLGLTDGEEVLLRACTQVSSCLQVVVEPLTADDWEILELHSSSLETHLLDQIRIVFPQAVFPVWVEQHTLIYIKVGSLIPAATYGRLEPLTELLVSPKLRGSASVSSHPPSSKGTGLNRRARKSNLNHGYVEKHSPRQTFQESRATESCDSRGSDRQDAHRSRDVPRPSLLSGFWSFVSQAFYGTSKEQQVLERDRLTSIENALRFLDTALVFRVCRSVPFHLDLKDSSAVSLVQTLPSSVCIFPWNQEFLDTEGSRAVTYGKLSKLLSPRQQKEETKQSLSMLDKRKAAETSGSTRQSATSQGQDDDSAASFVVKVLCYGFADLKTMKACSKNSTALHVGNVWIPEHLRQRVNIDLSAAVVIRPLEYIPLVPALVKLQPIETLLPDASEEELKSAFASWLQVSSTDNLPWLTAKTNSVSLLVKERVTEFAFSAEPSPGNVQTKSDGVFMLSPSLLQKTNIQTHKCSIVAAREDFHSRIQHAQWNCDALVSVGVQETSSSAFEHINHSLLGSPLSRELASFTLGICHGALLLTGAKGSGKSTVARAICREAADKLDAHVEIIDCKALRGKRLENIRKKLKEAVAEAAWRQPSVVLLDDVDQVAGAALAPEQEQGPEAVLSRQLAQAVKDMVTEVTSQRNLISVIATSLSEQSLHSSLISAQGTHLFQWHRDIQPPNQEQRIELLRCVVRNKTNVGVETMQSLDLESLAKQTEGFVARDFAALVERAVHAFLSNNRDCTDQVSEFSLSTSDFQRALKGFLPSSLRNAELHKPENLSWDRVGGLREVKQLLVDTIQLPAKYPVLFANLPIRQRSGILLYGAPGTGKTLLAGVVAQESGMNFISIKGPELLSKYIGASEQAVRDIFSRAQAAKPCILFFDEFDSLAPRRGHDNTGVTDRVVNQLLTQLDGVEGLHGVYVIAATSRPDLIDPALLRPGRLDKSVYCPPSDKVARLEILKALSQSLPLGDDVDLQQIAVLAECYTGADVKALLYNAQLEAVHSSQAVAGPQDAGLGSDSDGSLSSMIFLNNSSGSDDSTGDPEGGLEQSLVYLDTSELLPEDPQQNIWRLYFGSSYESELENGVASGMNSQCQSGPNSMTHELTGTSIRDTVSSHPPAFMASLQEGFQELSQEQMEQLRAEIGTIKANCKNRTMEDMSLNQTVQTKTSLTVCQSHLLTALTTTRPSISQDEWKKWTDLYSNFQRSQDGKDQGGFTLRAGQKVTLA
nr:PREDICTED: peroxisome biogenesis factor 1 [Latimeria chalumnae]|eukprot:XP_014347945.1 PREDICTED: peroxisome biogenesis factor 1 [Latimeria chalumnae]